MTLFSIIACFKTMRLDSAVFVNRHFHASIDLYTSHKKLCLLVEFDGCSFVSCKCVSVIFLACKRMSTESLALFESMLLMFPFLPEGFFFFFFVMKFSSYCYHVLSSAVCGHTLKPFLSLSLKYLSWYFFFSVFHPLIVFDLFPLLASNALNLFSFFFSR